MSMYNEITLVIIYNNLLMKYFHKINLLLPWMSVNTVKLEWFGWQIIFLLLFQFQNTSCIYWKLHFHLELNHI